MKDLRLALSRIEEAAVEWYPRPVAEVFRCVYANSLSELLDQAPQNLLHATINLYTHVFTILFQSIREELPADFLVPQAQAIMTRGSLEYERLVRNVIDEGLIATWARNQPSRQSPRLDRNFKSSNSRRSTRDRPTTPTIPAELKALIPIVDDSQVCLRFQTAKSCDFSGCRNKHELVRLPTEVFDYVTNKHGDLKAGHPNLSN
ncbi:hypothetical protein DVH05_001636 [Phytophthora capsici]|nr:hypothetical protein DVH05_001636 [Phytophthora capsici]